MTGNDPLAIRAVVTLLQEAFQRAPDVGAYFLNPGDPGLIETLRAVSAEAASTPPAAGRKPVVAHANHVLYGVELANRALAGEQGVYESADWSRAWQLESVSENEWQALVDRLAEQSQRLSELVRQPRDWDEIPFTGVYSIAVHTAYHLGAIRQMLLDLSPSP